MTCRIVVPLLVSVALAGASLSSTGCSRNPEVAKRKFVESGNKYFENGKYKEASIMYRRALEKDKKFGEAYYRQALVDMKLGEYPSAVAYLQRAVELSPDNIDAHTQLIDIYLTAYATNRSKPQEYLKELQSLSDRLRKKDANSFDAARVNGYLALTRQDLPVALASFQKAITIKPDDPKGAVPYANALIANQRWPEAEKYALDFLNRKKDATGMYDLLAIQYGIQKRPTEMESILKRKADNNPTQAVALLDLAGLYGRTNRRSEMETALAKLKGDPKSFPEGTTLVGDFFARSGEFGRARQEYEQAIKGDNKQKPALQQRIAQTLISERKYADATKVVEEILQADPKNNDALSMRASLKMQSAGTDTAKLQSAIDDYKTVLSRDKDADVYLNLGRAQMRKGEIDQARGSLQEAVRLKPGLLAARLVLSELLLRQGDNGKALQGADEILKSQPTNGFARLIRTQAMINLGNAEQARQELLQVQQSAPDNRDVQFQIALSHAVQRQFPQALQIFTKLQEAGDPRGFVGVTDTYLAQGQYKPAMDMLQAELAKNPKRLDLEYKIGNVALATNDLALAQSSFEKVMAQQPKVVDLKLRMAEIERRQGKIDQAVSRLRQAQTEFPNNPSVMMMLAQVLETAGRSSESRPVYEQLLKLQSDNPVALNNVAYAMAESGKDLDSALSYVQRARQRVPDNSDIADTMAYIYVRKNLNDPAVSLLRGIIEKNPGNPTYRTHLAMALLQKGDKVQAKRELEVALRSNPRPADQEKIKDLMSKTI